MGEAGAPLEAVVADETLVDGVVGHGDVDRSGSLRLVPRCARLLAATRPDDRLGDRGGGTQRLVARLLVQERGSGRCLSLLAGRASRTGTALASDLLGQSARDFVASLRLQRDYLPLVAVAHRHVWVRLQLSVTSLLGGWRRIVLSFEAVLVVRVLVGAKGLEELDRLLHGLHDLLLLEHLLELPFSSAQLIGPPLDSPLWLLLVGQVAFALTLCIHEGLLVAHDHVHCVETRLAHMPLTAERRLVVDGRLLAVPLICVTNEDGGLRRVVSAGSDLHLMDVARRLSA